MIKLLIIIIIVLCLFVFFIPVHNYIFMHEKAHQIINQAHGADSNIEIGFLSGTTIQTSPYASADYQKQAMALNSVNEIVSYNVSSLLIILTEIVFAGFMVICFFLFKIEKLLELAVLQDDR